MDRVQFMRCIEESNVTHADILSKFFDQYMILYNLIEKIDRIIFLSSDNNNVVFQLCCSDEKVLPPIIDRIQSQSMVMIYNKTFTVQYSNITANTIDISITLM